MPRYRFPAPGTPDRGQSPREQVRPGAAQPAVASQTALEAQFPHILISIQALWGFRELNTYFTKLTLDERGNRAGFPPEVWDEIYMLLRLHQDIVPEPLFASNLSRHALDFARTFQLADR